MSERPMREPFPSGATLVIGQARGWSIDPHDDGTCGWSAYGPCGVTHATADSETAARTAAQAEAERLASLPLVEVGR